MNNAVMTNVESVKDYEGNERFLALVPESIDEVKETDAPLYGYRADGYTCSKGAPTRFLVRLRGDSVWRRLRCIQISNAGSLVLTVNKHLVFVREYEHTKLTP